MLNCFGKLYVFSNKWFLLAVINRIKSPIMNTNVNTFETTQLLDLSEQSELNYWAEKLGVRPEVIKTAVRASRNNSITSIVNYLKTYKISA